MYHLQNDLNNLYDWCLLNNLHLDFAKCIHVSFSRSRNPIASYFRLGDHNLTTVDSVTDLGIIFDSKMSFIPHMNYILPKAYRILAFIRRNCSDFSDPNTLKWIYTSYVRSKLEYAAVVWSPHCGNHISRIERIQRVYLKYALKSFRFVDPLPSYKARGLL